MKPSTEKLLHHAHANLVTIYCRPVASAWVEGEVSGSNYWLVSAEYTHTTGVVTQKRAEGPDLEACIRGAVTDCLPVAKLDLARKKKIIKRKKGEWQQGSFDAKQYRKPTAMEPESLNGDSNSKPRRVVRRSPATSASSSRSTAAQPSRSVRRVVRRAGPKSK